MASQSFEITAHSTADPEAVFATMADIPRWREWAGPIAGTATLERAGIPDAHGAGAIRKFGFKPIVIREEIVESTSPSHQAYVLRSGVPVHGYRADVYLSPGPTGGTNIRWSGGFERSPRGTAAIFRVFLKAAVNDLARHLVKGAVKRA